MFRSTLPNIGRGGNRYRPLLPCARPVPGITTLGNFKYQKYIFQQPITQHVRAHHVYVHAGPPALSEGFWNIQSGSLKYVAGVSYVENVDHYEPGGFHPVRLHDRLKDNRYEIWHKLGYGGHATVWLARDTFNNYNVSIKILKARDSGDGETVPRELQVLSHLSRSTLQHPGRKFIPNLIDHFYIQGINGRHLCLVMNIAGPHAQSVLDFCKGPRLLGLRGLRLPGPLARKASRQLLLAVDYLFKCGVVHGDIHTGNILFRWGGMDTIPVEEIRNQLGTPSTGVVICRPDNMLPQNVPDYVVEPMECSASYPKVDITTLNEIQLIDFGEAFFINESPRKLRNPVAVRSPELVFGLGLTPAVDIWNCGHAIYELVLGSVMFAFARKDELPRLLIDVFGEVPKDWISNAITLGIFTQEQMNGNEYLKTSFSALDEDIRISYGEPKNAGNFESEGKGCFTQKELDMLTRCLHRMFKLEAIKRATAQELLDDDWFVLESEVW